MKILEQCKMHVTPINCLSLCCAYPLHITNFFCWHGDTDIFFAFRPFKAPLKQWLLMSWLLLLLLFCFNFFARKTEARLKIVFGCERLLTYTYDKRCFCKPNASRANSLCLCIDSPLDLCRCVNVMDGCERELWVGVSLCVCVCVCVVRHLFNITNMRTHYIAASMCIYYTFTHAHSNTYPYYIQHTVPHFPFGSMLLIQFAWIFNGINTIHHSLNFRKIYLAKCDSTEQTEQWTHIMLYSCSLSFSLSCKSRIVYHIDY